MNRVYISDVIDNSVDLVERVVDMIIDGVGFKLVCPTY